jgi:outer membrane protein assembly factor BamB
MRMMVTTLVLLSTPANAAAENWTQFRGPGGQGHSTATGLPVTWSEAEHIKWKTPIPHKGWSSPVIWGDQIWLTSATVDGKQMFGICLDRQTGKVLRQALVLTNEKPAFCHPFNSYASPTPAIEEGRVYLHFGTYGTVCLDTATGETLWSRRDLHCDHFRGPGSSPILYGGLLIVQFDGFDVQFIVALDKKTGRTVWKKSRDLDYGSLDGDFKKAYSTPAVIDVNGKPLLISAAALASFALDPTTGEEVWRVMQGGMNTAPPPLIGLGRLFLCTGDGGFKLFALRPDGRGDVTHTHIDWKYTKGVPSRCGPVLVGDLLYMVHETGIFTCIEAKTGRQVWQHRLGGQFTASLLYADGRIYCCSQEGLTHVIEPGRQPKVLAVNKLDDGFMASPAAADRSLFLRTRSHLYCVEQGKAE